MIDTTLQTFQQDVLDASMQLPVLVDFWAEWCGPCKTLGPMLEKLETAYGGRFKLVKVDTEKEQQLGQHFKIRSIPTVFAIVGGKVVDQFQGALPEGKLREFIDKLMPNPSDIEFEQAMQALDAEDLVTAFVHIKKAIALDPGNDSARLIYAQLLLQSADAAAANEQVQSLSAAAKADPQTVELIQQIKLALESIQIPSNPALQARIEANPKDLEARLALAEHYVEHKAWEQAFEQLLTIVKTDRAFQDDIGRKKMIEVFNLAATQPQLVSDWRRKLSASIF
jgi:putative thioredoxin